MKFLGKMRLMIILKVTKNRGFTLSLEDTFVEKPQGGCQIDAPPPPAALGLNTFAGQITIYQISFEIFDIKQIDTQAKM